jgi:hypothetical protein
MWKWAGYKGLFASIFYLSLAVIHVVNNHSCGSILMNVKRETITAAYSMAPKWISPQWHCGLSVCSLACKDIQHPVSWPRMHQKLAMEKSSHPNNEEKALVPNPNMVTCQ